MIVSEEVQTDFLDTPAEPADPDQSLLESAKPAKKRSSNTARNIGLVLAFFAVLFVGMEAGAHISRMRANRPVVVVNGVSITRDDLLNGLQSYGISNSPAGLVVMRNLVQQELQVQFAKKLGEAPTEQQIDEEYDKVSSQPNFQDMMDQSLQSPGTIRKQIIVRLSQSNVLCKGLTVSESEIRNYYRRQIDPNNPSSQFYKPDTVILRVIMTADRGDADKAMQELAASTPFELVAGAYSIAPNARNNGGLSNPLERGRSALSRYPALEQAVFNLPVGQQMGPIQVGTQWWIVRSVDKQAAMTMPYTQVRDECRKAALIEKGIRVNGPAVDALFQKFQKQSLLQAWWPQYQSVVQQ